MTISGQVNEALLYFDDSNESDVFQTTNSSSSTRVRLKGNAKINSDWSAGYYIEYEFATTRTLGISAGNDDGGGVGSGSGVGLRQANMYVKSKTLGKLTWGQGSSATDDIAFFSSVSGIAGSHQGDWHYSRSINIGAPTGAPAGTNLTNADLVSAINGGIFFDGTTRQNVVRYDTPNIAGFTLSAAWGEDDFWDVAARFKGKFGDFGVKASIGYFEFDGSDVVGRFRGITEETSFIAGAGIIHNPTGLFIHGEYRTFDYEGAAAGLPDSKGWSVNGGIKRRFNSLGKTALYVAYTQVDDGYVRATLTEVANGSSTEATRLTFGINQWIDAAALELYAQYNHNESEVNGEDLNDVDTVVLGGRIKF